MVKQTQMKGDQNMWGYNHFSSMGRFGGMFFGGGGFFSLLSWVLIAIVIVWVVKKFLESSKSAPNSYQDRNDSLEILKCRYAKGELSHEEYTKIKNTLNES